MGSSKNEQEFNSFFTQATGFSKPYHYQRRLAIAAEFPELLAIPTGVGKTAAVVLGWLFRQFLHSDDETRKTTPRRLVYCLPMRTLVEQTERAAVGWLENLAKQDSQFGKDSISVHTLMGGADPSDWDEHPERAAILIGTQDMLLSRALNRGYGMSRYRWPMHFGLLNNDCLWVLDETQLMGVGVTTSAQLQVLRTQLETYGVTRSLWMSATLDRNRLDTVDHPTAIQCARPHELEPDDLNDDNIKQLIHAKKPCRMVDVRLTPDNVKKGYDTTLAEEVLNSHRPGTLTLVVVNQVARAQVVFKALDEQLRKVGSDTELFLIHSRFRKCDRREAEEKALAEETVSPDSDGRIVVATQAIEAGVDVSATTLFTELAPWPSLVQRFGRCNRRGKCGVGEASTAQVRWIDLDTPDAKRAESLALPYTPDELDTAREYLQSLSNVGPKSLEAIVHKEPPRNDHTLRRKDLLELWDTTPDLAGNDLDISRYIRDGDDTDVQVYWREWGIEGGHAQPPQPKNADGQPVFAGPSGEELCSVSIGNVKTHLTSLHKRKAGKKGKIGEAWTWDPLDRSWKEVKAYDVRPGMLLLLHVEGGGYCAERGWTGDTSDEPDDRCSPALEAVTNEAYGDDDFGTAPMLLTQHLQRVFAKAEELEKGFNGTFGDVPWDVIRTAALWHDMGKAHPAFQAAMHDGDAVRSKDPDGKMIWAKSGTRGIPNYRVVEQDNQGGHREDRRRGFRHELASALAWLHNAEDDAHADLVAFLIASHHGKVRGSIRSLPNEQPGKDPARRFARGLRDGDLMPSVNLGDGHTTDSFEVDLSLMELGEDESGRPSWLARALQLREKHGPFRLSYLETLVRIADWRGSNEGGISND